MESMIFPIPSEAIMPFAGFLVAYIMTDYANNLRGAKQEAVARYASKNRGSNGIMSKDKALSVDFNSVDSVLGKAELVCNNLESELWAKALGIAGIQSWQIENGKVDISQDQLTKLVKDGIFD